jgi:hypothetical protein
MTSSSHDNLSSSIPLCFQPNLSHHGSFSYKNLSGKSFSFAEKEWLCREVLGRNEVRDDQDISKKGIIRRYGIYSSFFKKNLNNYLSGNMKANTGKPIGISSVETEIIKDKVFKMKQSGTPLLVDEVKSINVAYQRTSMMRGSSEVPEMVDKRTFTKFIQSNGMAERAISGISDAQVNACKCPFMSYMWYLVNLAFANELPSTNKWNLDAITHCFEPSGKNGRAIIILDENKYVNENGDADLQLNFC